ncbi:MAG: hypothetical protein ACFFG0_26495 [Candidatus Thorarchaeota archaeon]
MVEKAEKVIEIRFNNESIQSCINTNEISKLLENPNIKEKLDKCLRAGTKLFTH